MLFEMIYSTANLIYDRSLPLCLELERATYLGTSRACLLLVTVKEIGLVFVKAIRSAHLKAMPKDSYLVMPRACQSLATYLGILRACLLLATYLVLKLVQMSAVGK